MQEPGARRPGARGSAGRAARPRAAVHNRTVRHAAACPFPNETHRLHTQGARTPAARVEAETILKKAMRRALVALGLIVVLPGCGTSEFVREVNATWEPSIARGKQLVTPAMIDECRARIFAATKEEQEVTPLATNIDLTKFVVNKRYLILLARENLQPGDIFLLVGRFKYQHWGLPGEGKWGCTWKMVGDSAEFIEEVSPSDFKANIYVNM